MRFAALSAIAACLLSTACGESPFGPSKTQESRPDVTPRPRVIAKGVTLRSNPKADEVMSMVLVKEAMDSIPKDDLAQVMMLVSCRQRMKEGDPSWSSRPDEIRRARAEISSNSPIAGTCGEEAMRRRSTQRFIVPVPRKAVGSGRSVG